MRGGTHGRVGEGKYMDPTRLHLAATRRDPTRGAGSAAGLRQPRYTAGRAVYTNGGVRPLAVIMCIQP